MIQIVGMNAQGDARNHRERTRVIEHAKHVARDASVFHLVPTETRKHALVTPASELMGTSLSALEFHACPKQHDIQVPFEYR